MKNRIKSEHRVLLSSKKIVSLMLVFAFCFVVFAQENVKNVIIVNNGENLSASENSWLPASVKDRFESNLQTYTIFSFITSNDSKIKELQKKFQSGIFDEENAIELGKMTAASHAVLLSTRKAGTVYTITAEFINLTTGKSIAKCVSPSKNKTSELFSDAGCAADLLTIDFCEKIGIKLAGIQIITLKGLDVSDADAIKFYNQEIENYKKQMANLDKEILLLSKSSDLDAASRKAKLESERAIAEQKKKLAEENKIRLANIEKAKIEEAAVNATRTKEQQRKILEVSNESNRKINELKKLKIENLSALGKIRLIETKKRAILDIRKNITEEQNEEKANISKEYEEKILAIKNMPYRTAEKNADGTVAKEVIADRNKKIVALQEERDTLIKSADKKIEEATIENLANIVTDISLDLEDLQSDFFYANTLNKDLLVRLGNYNRSSDGWELFYSVLCDGMLVEEFKTELKFNEIEKLIPSEMEKYDAIDMYDSLFKCGEPVLTFGLTYNIDISESDFSKYKFIIDELSVYDTKIVGIEKNGAIKGKGFRCGKQNTVLKQMTPAYSLPGIISENNQSDEFWSSVLELVPEKLYEKETEKIKTEISSKMIAIPEKKISIMSTEVTQGLWKAVMGTNPSYLQNTHNRDFINRIQFNKVNLTEEEIKRINTDNYPVEQINWEEAIHFCNELSKRFGLEPCYYNEGGWKFYVENYNGSFKEVSAEVYEKTDKYKYGEYIVSCNFEANGFRLPTLDEWFYAAKGGEEYKYPGSDDLNEVAWFDDNSNKITHPVAQKKANGYGLYDMFGNVGEFCHKSREDIIKPSSLGGSYVMGEGSVLDSYYNLDSITCRVNVNKSVSTIESSYRNIGFRIVCGLNNSGITNAQSEKIINEYNQKLEQEEAERNKNLHMVKVPGKDFSILDTEVTQQLYKRVMAKNPSKFKNDLNPVECVDWLDAIHFCNELSKLYGLEPCYFNETGTRYYIGNKEVTIKKYINSKDVTKTADIYYVECNFEANGFRLPTFDEWLYAAKGGEDFIYSGSNDFDEVAWVKENSENEVHPVAQKKANGYGLYDMIGNVGEWCWNKENKNHVMIPYVLGHNFMLMGKDAKLDAKYNSLSPFDSEEYVGFRIVRKN